MLNRNFILTGATGAGKTTIIEHLRGSNHRVVREAFMDVYRLVRDRGCSDPFAYPGLLDDVTRLQCERQQALKAPGQCCVYFDRSPLCTLALSRFMGRLPSAVLQRELERMRSHSLYATDVFFVQNLGFAPGNEVTRMRYEDLLAFEGVHREVYVEYGHNCIDVPPLPVQERVGLILQHAGGKGRLRRGAREHRPDRHQ